jgi:hypothetical protein
MKVKTKKAYASVKNKLQERDIKQKCKLYKDTGNVREG